MRGPRSTAWLGLTGTLLAAVALRAWVLSGPLGEVEADESVVGLMALHIQAGERPIFYWGQPYLGSLEAYLVAASFTFAPATNLVLKSVPGFIYLIFLVLVFLGARRDYGNPVALLSALYLALPPSFLALWSIKARGGYIELLALGQALFYICPWIAQSSPGLPLRVGLAGILAGLLLWTHVLGLIYVAPAAIYLLARLRGRLAWLPALASMAGALLGIAPALAWNIENNWETFTALSGAGSSQESFQENLSKLAQIGAPVMVGLGQATSSPVLFAQDWPNRPGSWSWVPALLLTLVILALVPSLRTLPFVFRARGSDGQSTAFFGLAVLALTPVLASLGRFGELVAEPRYALPLYSTTPLFAAAAFRLRGRLRPAAALVIASAFAINAYSLLTADPRLSLPTTAGASTTATRADLTKFLERSGIGEIYTDYWLAYPIMFETQQRVLAAVSSGGYNRFPPYAHLVSTAEQPAFVFVSDSPEQTSFERRLRELGGRAERETVSIYQVYRGVEPLGTLRP